FLRQLRRPKRSVAVSSSSHIRIAMVARWRCSRIRQAPSSASWTGLRQLLREKRLQRSRPPQQRRQGVQSEAPHCRCGLRGAAVGAHELYRRDRGSDYYRLSRSLLGWAGVRLRHGLLLRSASDLRWLGTAILRRTSTVGYTPARLGPSAAPR